MSAAKSLAVSVSSRLALLLLSGRLLGDGREGPSAAAGGTAELLLSPQLVNTSRRK